MSDWHFSILEGAHPSQTPEPTSEQDTIKK